MYTVHPTMFTEYHIRCTNQKVLYMEKVFYVQSYLFFHKNVDIIPQKCYNKATKNSSNMIIHVHFFLVSGKFRPPVCA